MLSIHQQKVFDAYLEGKNVFMTGAGGCGKSYLIHRIVEDGRKRGKNVAVCAMTGCAAILIDGKTLHSWAGIGIGNEDRNVILQKVMYGRSAVKHRWRNTHILIIDEVSMMSREMFELIDAVGRMIRGRVEPFGGIQIIMSGDFYQLPPIGVFEFCFESPLWNSVFKVQVSMQMVFRQTDEKYKKILNGLREGRITRSGIRELEGRVEAYKQLKDSEHLTHIFPLKYQVEAHNRMRQAALAADSEKQYNTWLYINGQKYPADKWNEWKKLRTSPIGGDDWNAMKDNIIEVIGGRVNDGLLCLRIGSRVMLTMNMMDEGLCNGSVGVIEGFEGEKPIVNFVDRGRRTMEYQMITRDKGVILEQMPLILAFAVSIHKIQGATLDSAVINCGEKVFETGQTYVALSRVRSLEGLYLTEFSLSGIKVNKRVVEYYKSFELM
jgi:ATP-dependent DNA helicase PIF1